VSYIEAANLNGDGRRLAREAEVVPEGEALRGEPLDPVNDDHIIHLG